MRRFARVVLTPALALAACSPDKPPVANEAAVKEVGANVSGPPDCPEEELSCGKQKPVVSDGVKPFENENYEVRAFFPKGDRICMSRSGNAPHGFYADYETATPCAEHEPYPPGMGIYAEFNLTYLSAEMVVRDWITAGHCKVLSASLLRAFGGKPPVIAGHPSVACEKREDSGEITVTVHALAGQMTNVDLSPDLQKRGRAPDTAYFATLRTRPDRLKRDVAQFQTFLRRLQIGVQIDP